MIAKCSEVNETGLNEYFQKGAILSKSRVEKLSRQESFKLRPE